MKCVFLPIHTYGHESLVMTERVLSQAEAAEMVFLRNVHDTTHRYKVRSFEFCKILHVT